jgi:hypothetical protein
MVDISLQTKQLKFDSYQEKGTIIFAMMIRLSLKSTQPLIQWVSGAISLGVMWPKHDPENSSQCKNEVSKCMQLCIHLFSSMT